MSSWKGKALYAEVPLNGGYLSIYYETEGGSWMAGFSKRVELQLNPSNADLAAVCEEQNYEGPIIRYDLALSDDAFKAMHEAFEMHVAGQLNIEAYIHVCTSHCVPIQYAEGVRTWRVHS